MPKYEDADDFLAHHGVMGMHWGQHKAKTQFHDSTTGHTTKKAYPVTATHEHVQARELQKKPLHELSNQELKKLTERQQLEQKHKQLNPNGWNKTKTAILGTTALLGTAATLYGHYNSPAGKKLRAAGKTAFEHAAAKRASSTLLKDAAKSAAAAAGKKALMLALEA